ncbi:DNA-3-methyladenine glycosylase [Paenibacillus sp. P26]|nr:DNA-3-methyladenine glycosylase [Paenibacillus sp. P26]UUZ94611.1 DNA-3-methyladenine glycosylase [Paenibacillus sp. P25]
MLRTDKGVYLAEIRSTGTTEEPVLEVRISGLQEPNPSEVLKLKTRLERMLSAGVDLQPFYSHMRSLGPEMEALTMWFRGLHLLTEADLFECMCKTIIGQRLNLAFASELTKRLMAAATAPYAADGMEYPVFPSPEEVARLDYKELQELQFSRRKAEYVIDWARKIADGSVELNRLEGLSDEQIIEELTRLRGIRRWTVECFLLFGLGRTNLLPAADIGLRNALKKLYALTDQPTEPEVRRMGAEWSPWASYATLYLWESLHAPEREASE